MGEPKAANSKIWLVGIIAVALIGCLGAIMAALIGILPQVIETRTISASERATATPGNDIDQEATELPAPTSEPDIEFPPTVTPPPPPTELPPTPIPDTSPGTILDVGQSWRQVALNSG